MREVYGNDFKGRAGGGRMNERNALLCEQLKAKGITPTLAVVRVGEREDDLSYERGVMTRCGKVGVAVRQFVLLPMPRRSSCSGYWTR